MELYQRLNNVPKTLQIFKVVRAECSLEIFFDDGMKFGVLDKRTSETLSTIVDRPELQIDGLAETDTIRTVICSAQKAKDALIRIDIHIYGPISLSDEVGNSFSVKKTWLQRPTAPRFPYRNPQTVVFPGVENGLPQVQCPGSESNGKVTEDLHKTIAEVYGSMKRGKDLHRIKGDVGLKTHLLE